MSCVPFPLTDLQPRDPASLQRCGWSWAVVQLCPGLTNGCIGIMELQGGPRAYSFWVWLASVSFLPSFLSTTLYLSPSSPSAFLPPFLPWGKVCEMIGGYIKEDHQTKGKNTMGSFSSVPTLAPPTIYLPWFREINWGQKDLYVPAAA